MTNGKNPTATVALNVWNDLKASHMARVAAEDLQLRVDEANAADDEDHLFIDTPQGVFEVRGKGLDFRHVRMHEPIDLGDMQGQVVAVIRRGAGARMAMVKQALPGGLGAMLAGALCGGLGGLWLARHEGRTTTSAVSAGAGLGATALGIGFAAAMVLRAMRPHACQPQEMPAEQD